MASLNNMPNTKRLLRILRKRTGPKRRSEGKRRGGATDSEIAEWKKKNSESLQKMKDNRAKYWATHKPDYSFEYRNMKKQPLTDEQKAKKKADDEAFNKQRYGAYEASVERAKARNAENEKINAWNREQNAKQKAYDNSFEGRFAKAVIPLGKAVIETGRAVGKYGKYVGLPPQVTMPIRAAAEIAGYATGQGIPSDEMYKMAAKNAYDAQAGPMPAGYRPIFSSSTLKIWHNPQDGDIFVAVRGTYDASDMSANATLPFNKLESTTRYKKDEADLLRVMRRYPNSKVHFSSHSLGSAIARRLERKVNTASSRAFNPAFEPAFMKDAGKQQRIYRGNDFLGQVGRYLPGAQLLPPAKTDQPVEKTKWYDPRTWQAFQHHSLSGFGGMSGGQEDYVNSPEYKIKWIQHRLNSRRPLEAHIRALLEGKLITLVQQLSTTHRGSRPSGSSTGSKKGGMDPAQPATPARVDVDPTNPSPVQASPPPAEHSDPLTKAGKDDAQKFGETLIRTVHGEPDILDFYNPPGDATEKSRYIEGWRIIADMIPQRWPYAESFGVHTKINDFLRSRTGRGRSGGSTVYSSASSSDSSSVLPDIDEIDDSIDIEPFMGSYKEPRYIEEPQRLKRMARKRKARSSFSNPVVERSTKTAQKQIAARAVKPPAERNYSVVSLVL